MYTLKSITRRGTLLGAAAALVVAAIIPAASAFADTLNPLTNRTLLLSSSAPGWQNTDGSGNSEDQLNGAPPSGEQYAPPGSGANGMKTGETFSFHVSTDSDATSTPIKAFTLQYCTTAAGLCQAPGDNSGDARTPDRKTNADALSDNDKTSDLDVVGEFADAGNGALGAGQFQVLINGVASNKGWTMKTKNVEDNDYDNDQGRDDLTGKKNFIILTSATGDSPAFNDKVEIVFKPSSSIYITNPGSGAFFVKINTYKEPADAAEADTRDGVKLLPATAANIIDGGVTVANVMNDSIHIMTKVLETMRFSVGTVNPDTQAIPHGSCDAIQETNGNLITLGNPSAEDSLDTEQAYDAHSYWRLSSNSSAGATVYYSGETLQNTVGDAITSMEAKAHSKPGTEQFGLAVNAPTDPTDNELWTAQDEIDDPLHEEGTPKRPFPDNWTAPHVTPLAVLSDYSGGSIATISDRDDSTNNAEFTFKRASNTVPVPIAENTLAGGGSGGVISCSTAKMRYVANIAADTPAGIYTTKINYLAAPLY